LAIFPFLPEKIAIYKTVVIIFLTNKNTRFTIANIFATFDNMLTKIALTSAWSLWPFL
jgi:hypothetical protein